MSFGFYLGVMRIVFLVICHFDGWGVYLAFNFTSLGKPPDAGSLTMKAITAKELRKENSSLEFNLNVNRRQREKFAFQRIRSGG
jgi:hypothetical protein